jgi:hypothetical protein
MLVVKLSVFNTRKDGSIVQPDKAGFMPLYMTVISGGELPENAKILNGTIAENQGMVVGKVYAITVNELESDPIHGEQFEVQNMMELGFKDIQGLNIQGVKRFTPKAVEADEVVAGAKTKEIKI